MSYRVNLIKSLSVCILSTCTWSQLAAQESVSTMTTQTMSFGDWSVRCEKTDQQAESCAMTASVVVPQSRRQIFEMNLAKVDKGTQMTIVLPLGIHLPKGVEVEVVDWEKVSFPISFCTQAGCFVNQILQDDLVDLLRKKERATVTLWPTAAEKATIPLSLSGFLEAYKKL